MSNENGGNIVNTPVTSQPVEEASGACCGSKTDCGAPDSPTVDNAVEAATETSTANEVVQEVVQSGEVVESTQTDSCEKGQDVENCKLPETECCQTRTPGNENS